MAVFSRLQRIPAVYNCIILDYICRLRASEILFGLSDKENFVDFFLNLIFAGEPKICLGSMHFSEPQAALKTGKRPA